MTLPDFEITARLAARELRTRVAPDAHLGTTGPGVTLACGEVRMAAHETVEACQWSTDVIVEKLVAAGWQAVAARDAVRDTAGARGASEETPRRAPAARRYSQVRVQD